MSEQKDKTKELLETIASIDNTKLCEQFFRDLTTSNELHTMAERWEIAKLVEKGDSYREIAKQTGASTATITRVAQWLKHGMGGYKELLKRK